MTKSNILCFVVLLFMSWASIHAQAQSRQFRMVWMDIGDMHSRYNEVGALPEGLTQNRSIEWPAILRGSGHIRSKAYWIGLKNWIDETGQEWEYQIARAGPSNAGDKHFTPIETRLVAKFEDTEVVVNGYLSRRNLDNIVDKIDPTLPADRMLYQKFRSIVGIETERWVYAYAHETHDDYHIIRRRMNNNGNTDADADIELPNQSLNGVYFSNLYRWAGRSQAGWVSSVAQVWGRYSMVDIVGDGHEDYPVDFTAIYSWAGFDPDFAWRNWDHLGSPMIIANQWTTPGDTTGRLAGMSMQGRVVLHADASATDATYNPLTQPDALGWVNSDHVGQLAFGRGPSLPDIYERIIRTPENPDLVPGGSSRMYPHYADRIEPTGEFWNPIHDASGCCAGGWTPTVSYGPYQIAFGDSIEIVEAEGAAGISYAAASVVGAAFKASGFSKDARISFDANGDGLINDVPWDYDVYKNGSERQTKNQWFLTARDSMFQFMFRARDVWNASNKMSRYPIIEPPRPPRMFEVTGQPEHIMLRWETMTDSPDPVQWEISRTSEYVDNLPYERIATLPGSARNYNDISLIRGVDYYYFIQAVGQENPVDEKGITGTPGGLPLRSGRFFTQTYDPVTLLREPGGQVTDFSIVPNPLNMASDESVRLFVNGNSTLSRVDFLDIPGHCTISIYTETGELVKRIEHTNGSGNTAWDLNTAARQPIVSGIYLVYVVDNDTGATDAKKLVVIK